MPVAPASSGAKVAFYLAGDSYPAQGHVEAALQARLRHHFIRWTGQQALLDRSGASAMDRAIDPRVAALRPWLPTRRERSAAVLFGRSSGARVATCFAARYGAMAAICFGYPFRVPHHCIEPARFAHLAGLAVPTLLFQGENDPYGGADITADYALSDAIAVELLPCDHEFHLPGQEWDRVALRCAAFLRQVAQGAAHPSPAFDEAYYLAAHRDVAAAVAAGEVASGAEHFRLYGRREGRSFRIARPALSRLATARHLG
ncbi:MAG: hypothetical protein KGL12_13455 [Rhodospirillales bacterium]|nr:hypothetical protein [Rhodospirillales bacterium]